MGDVVEGLPSGAWSLLGLELWGNGPLGHVRLPLVPDRLSVLYGLNGAGKSTVLGAVRSALRGTCAESPFLQRFRIHAELRDPEQPNSMTNYVARRLRMVARRAFDAPGRMPLPREALEAGPLPPLSEALRLHLSQITGDPSCPVALAEGLAMPEAARTPLRITVTGLASGANRIALAARPDGTAFSLLSGLLTQEAASHPDDPIVLGSPMSVVWEAIARTTDVSSVLHPGLENLEMLARAEGLDAPAIRRALAERWISDWLFAGEFPEAARTAHPPERWQSLPIAELANGPIGQMPTFSVAVASDSDDVGVAAMSIVRSIGAIEPPSRPEAMADDDEAALRDAEQMAWTMEQHAKEVEPQIIADMVERGELPRVRVGPFPNPPWMRQLRRGERQRPQGGPETGRMRRTIPEAVAAANAEIRAWAAAFIPLPATGFRDGPIVDRFRAFRDSDDIHPVEDDTLELEIGRLSTAQRRWVSIALAFLARRDWHSGAYRETAYPGISPHVVLLLDEPERSLHRGAERDVLRRLERLVTEENATAIIATHSPVLLESDAVVLHHVRMSDGQIQLQSDITGEADLGAIADRIGARRSDVAALHRVFVLVEGETDRAVLEGLFGEQFTALRASIVPMSGTDALHTAVTPHGLLRLTDASVVVLLDHVDDARLASVRTELARRIDDRGLRHARNWLAGQRFDRSAERAAAGLLTSALELGELDRVSIVGISVVDILELLPFDALGCQRSREEFEAAVAAESAAGRRWTSRRTKEWLQQGGADVSVDGVRRAVARMDGIPSDLVEVLNAVRRSAEHARAVVAAQEPVT